MTRHQDPRLATLDELIARQEQVLAALVAARALMAGDAPAPARKPDVKLLPAPAKAAGRKDKTETVDKAIEGLRSLLKNAGSKVELNGYRKRGFVLEMERD